MMQLLWKQVDTKRPFFALASVWAMIGPLVFLLSLYSAFELNLSVVDHGRGMLFGFTSALITGYMAGKRCLLEVLWLVVLWSFTRTFEILSTYQDFCLWFYVLYGGHLALIVAPKFLSAKKIRNWLMSPTLAVLALFPILLLIVGFNHDDRNELIFIFAQLLTLLMFFMAGRMITPLLVKANTKKGIKTKHRVQPSIEGAVIGFIIFSVVLKVARMTWFLIDETIILSSTHVVIALLIFIRIFRWKATNLSSQDGVVWGLLFGYCWLAISQIGFAIDTLQEQTSISGLHLLTIGGLGLLSSSIMTFSIQKGQSRINSYFIYIVLLSSSSLMRYLANLSAEHIRIILLLSAAAWCFTFFLVFLKIVAAKPQKLSDGSKAQRLKGLKA